MSEKWKDVYQPNKSLENTAFPAVLDRPAVARARCATVVYVNAPSNYTRPDAVFGGAWIVAWSR
jgi:hypothetical protein